MKPEWNKWLDRVPFSKKLGIEILEVNQGYAKGCIHMQKLHENQYGGMHGGALFTLADTITGVACLSHGRVATTVDANIHYLVAAPGNQTIFCEATQVKQGKTLGVYNCRIYGEDGRDYVSGTFTFFVFDTPVEEFVNTGKVERKEK